MKSLFLVLITLPILVSPPSLAADSTLYTCSQILSGNDSGQSEHSIAGGSVSISSIATNAGNIIEVNASNLRDSAGASLEFFTPFWAFSGAANGNPTSDKENEPGHMQNSPLLLKIDSGNLTEENEGRDWYRSKNSLQLNKQSGELQLFFGLRSCKNDFAGNCSFIFGGFQDIASVKMKCVADKNQ